MKEIVKLTWQRAYFAMFNRFTYRKVGIKVAIIKPVRVIGKYNIELGDRVMIREGAYLCANCKKASHPTLVISNGANIGHYAHIVANHEVVINTNVLIADKVFISDCSHNYENIEMPIIFQGVKDIKAVHIGEGSWIGDNVSIIGADIGEHSVIGANSVVTKDVPAYSVAVGCPAKVIKYYDFSENKWRIVNDI